MIPLYNAGSTKPHARFTPSAAEVPTIVQPGLAAIVPSSPWLHDSIPPAMFKLFVLWFAVLSLISVIQCTPTAVRRSGPSSKPESLVARGHCDFLCPYENVVGKKLSKSSADSGRLYCRYDVEETDDKAYCMYKRVRFSYGMITPSHNAHLPFQLRRTPENCFQALHLRNVTSKQSSIALARRTAKKI